jgi:hypothetical protein
MKGLVITPKNQSELKFLSDLLNKLGISASTLSQGELEDLGLLQLMKSANRKNKISRSVVLTKLKS